MSTLLTLAPRPSLEPAAALMQQGWVLLDVRPPHEVAKVGWPTFSATTALGLPKRARQDSLFGGHWGWQRQLHAGAPHL